MASLSKPCDDRIETLEDYERLYRESLDAPETFFGRHAREMFEWHRPFQQVCSQVERGFATNVDAPTKYAWFADGELNVAVNCVDRHARRNPHRLALIWEGDEPSLLRHVTYQELLEGVCRVANYMRETEGLRKGDAVAIYMPALPETVMTMLACARLGIVHTVIFAGFSETALAHRITDARCKLVFTVDEAYRGGKVLDLKHVVHRAVASCSHVQRVVVLTRRREGGFPLPRGPLDLDWEDAISRQSAYCTAEPLASEEPLFLLYTSGSTGKPKGVVHSQAGYLLMAALTMRYVFDCREGDRFGCMADTGWITGHTYGVYGPLCVGATTLLFEGMPTYPNVDRYWAMIDRHKITHFYTAPTALRTLKKLVDDEEDMERSNKSLQKVESRRDAYSLQSLRILGCVGEPMDPTTWYWYRHVFGRDQCPILDTYWQTETGAILLSPMPSNAASSSMKPGYSGKPFFGVELVLLNLETGDELMAAVATGLLALKRPLPSLARTLYGDHERFVSAYLAPYPGYYVTGDGASRDADGDYAILGRLDDVVNVSGHRLGSIELEAAFMTHPLCAEAAVVGIPDTITGQSLCAFVVFAMAANADSTGSASSLASTDASIATFSSLSLSSIRQLLREHIRRTIGPFATPKYIYVVPQLPKTRSGKVLRRLLRHLAAHDDRALWGDLSTLPDIALVEILESCIKG